MVKMDKVDTLVASPTTPENSEKVYLYPVFLYAIATLVLVAMVWAALKLCKKSKPVLQDEIEREFFPLPEVSYKVTLLA